MLDTTRSAPATFRHPALVHVLSEVDADSGQRCRIYHGDGFYDAWTWQQLSSNWESSLYCGHVTTLEIGSKQTDFVLLGLQATTDIPLSKLLCDALCPIPGVVRQTTALIDQIANQSIRAFLRGALLHPDALLGYWTSPASRRHHHAYPGGLAEHSLEVATMVATSSGLPDEDRELGIALALLHDYGKIWCYDPWVIDPIDSSMHVAHGLAKLHTGLELLHFAEHTIGARMKELLGGPLAPRRTPYPQAIGRIVHAFDQMSCEKTRRNLCKSRPTSSELDWA